MTEPGLLGLIETRSKKRGDEAAPAFDCGRTGSAVMNRKGAIDRAARPVACIPFARDLRQR
jgi:hypothetical protein